MPDYKQLYYTLFNDVSQTIERLQYRQQRCEELYIQAAGEEVSGLLAVQWKEVIEGDGQE